MLIEVLNNSIRETIAKLVKIGHPKAKLAEVMFRANGAVQLSEFLREENPREFGIKPLSRIGDVFSFQLKLVYVKDDDYELHELLENANLKFINEMETRLTTYLDKHSGINSENGSLTEKRQDKLLQLLDEIKNID